MDHIVGYGNTSFATGQGNVPKEGKMLDFEQCDSGIDSYIPSYDSERSNSYQHSADMSVTTKFSDLSLSTSQPSHTIGNQHDDQKSFERSDEQCDSGFASISISSIGSRSIPSSEDTSQEINISRFFAPDADGDTFLQLAIIQKKSDVAFGLIQCCTCPEVLDIGNVNQQTALHLSVAMDLPEITRCLVAYGADVRCKDRNGNTPLHLACEMGLLGQIEMLTAELDEEETTGYQKLSLPQCVNERNYSGFSPLHLAVIHNQIETVDVLIQDLKCDVDFQDAKSGRTALHHSIEMQNYRMTKFLVQNDADVNALTYDECSPLHFASARGLLKEADILLHHKADLYLITRDDYDVFELSVHSKNRRRMSAFLKKEDEQTQKKRMSHRGLN